MNYRIAIIGDSSTVIGFSAAGIEGFPVYESQDALNKIKELTATGEYAIIFVAETLAEPFLDELSSIDTGDITSVILIPDQSGAKGYGFEKIRNQVERALGIDILGKE